MPALKNHQSGTTTKLLLIGDSGAGKTGALVSLVQAGYKLRIVDYDNGLDIVANLIREKNIPLADDQVYYETCTDKMKSMGGKMVPDGVPQAFAKSMKLLDKWTGEGYDLGPVTSWGPDTVLVIDSMSLMGEAAMRHVLALNGRPQGPAQLQDWGTGQEMVKSCLAMLYSDAVKCNVIVISHIKMMGGEEGEMLKGMPNALGKALPPVVGRYFNACLMVKTKGAGANAKRIIRTVSEGFVELKNPNPVKVPAELPIETGLADYFTIVQGKK